MQKIRIMVVDDHKIVRDGIRAMLLGNPDIEMVAEHPGADGLKELIRDMHPDLVVMDISLQGGSGVDLTRGILDTFPLMKVIMLTANTNEDAVSASVRAGAKGFLSKDTSRDEFIKAVKTVFEGEEYYSGDVAKIIFRIFSKNLKSGENRSKSQEHNLTDRETEIIRLFAEGLSYKQIADKLFISTRTVETHKNNILMKLKLSNTIELVKYAIRHNITSL